MGVTSPDNIYVHENHLPASLVQVSQSEGASVQAALDKRQRYDFVWPTATERTAQTGMVQGSRGYQADTTTEWLFDNSNWRLAIGYALFNGSFSQPNGGWNSTVPTIDSGQSTDVNFVTTGSSGQAYLNFVNPGVYAVSWKNTLATPSTTSLQQMNLTTDTNNPYAISSVVPVASNGHLYTSIPAIRTASANTRLYFMSYQASGAAVNSTYVINVVRLG